MTFTRMYTEPSCTPTRVAVMTGRQPVRSGMDFPIFPIHQMGLPGSEVTIAEVLDDDYNTGFFEKSHFGDVEESYLHNQGYDEERLVALSFGDNRPLADNDTAEGRKQNRRIEIRLRPVDFSK